jgi:hypothetical protein
VSVGGEALVIVVLGGEDTDAVEDLNVRVGHIVDHDDSAAKEGSSAGLPARHGAPTHYLPSCRISSTVCDPMKPLPPAVESRVSPGELEDVKHEMTAYQ